MAFPMMPQVQWDLVRKMGPLELNKAAMGEYQAQGISPVFALARIKEETALAAAFEAQAQKQQQEEEAKMQGVPIEDIPLTVAEGILRERGITGVDSSAGQEMPPEQMAALQGGIAGGQPQGMEGPPPGMEGPPMGMGGPPPMMGGPPPMMGGPPPMMAYGGGLIPDYHSGGLVHGHGSGPGEHLMGDVPGEVERRGFDPLPPYQRVPHPRDWEGTEEEWMAARDAAIAREEDRSTRVGRAYENYVESLPPHEKPMSQSNWEGMEGREILSESSKGLRERFGSGRYGSPGQERLREIGGPEEYEYFRSLGPGAFPRMEPSWAERTGSEYLDAQQAPDSTDTTINLDDLAGSIVPPGSQVSGAESDADIIARKIGGTEQDVIPGDIEYSRYSDIDPGPSPSSVYNAMTQLSAEISDIQQAYGPDKQRLDQLRLGPDIPP